MKPKLVVFSGARNSAESGIKTFRDSNGLWEEYDINDVATPQASRDKNKPLVLEFYNKRRQQILDAKPNEAHKILVELENNFDVQIITQNMMIYMSEQNKKSTPFTWGNNQKPQQHRPFTCLYNQRPGTKIR